MKTVWILSIATPYEGEEVEKVYRTKPTIEDLVEYKNRYDLQQLLDEGETRTKGHGLDLIIREYKLEQGA